MQFRGISVALPTLWSYSSGDLWSCSYSDYSRMEIKLKFHFTSVCVCVCRRAESPVDYKLYPWTRWKEARTREIFESGWVGRFFSQFQWAIVIRVAISHPDAMFERFVELLAVILFSFFFFHGKGMVFRGRVMRRRTWINRADRSSIASMISENLENSIALIRSPWNEISWMKEGLPGLKGGLLRRISILRRDSSRFQSERVIHAQEIIESRWCYNVDYLDFVIFVKRNWACLISWFYEF